MNSLEDMITSRTAKLQIALLGWYAQNYRKLPWRMSPESHDFGDPYAIWVSEVMLQQTRMETVIPYFERFMAKYPNVTALAEAEESDLLKTWEGLGYYRRARYMHRAARQIVEKGCFPQNMDEALALPGVGRYIAGAVLSIAFGVPVAAVDGNVLRVLARWFALEHDIAKPATVKLFGQIAARLVPDGSVRVGQTLLPNGAGCWNQAVMELGGICLPGVPRCNDCPVFHICEAYKQKRTGELPVKTAKARPVDEKREIVVVWDGAYVLMREREPGLLGGMWEFPVRDDVRDWARKMAKDMKIAETPLLDAVHTFTHMRWRMTGYLWVVECAKAPEGWKWVDRHEFARIPHPVALKVYRQWVAEHLFGEKEV